MTVDIDDLCERIMDRCGDRDGPRVVEAIRMTLAMDAKDEAYRANSSWYRQAHIKEASDGEDG